METREAGIMFLYFSAAGSKRRLPSGLPEIRLKFTCHESPYPEVSSILFAAVRKLRQRVFAPRWLHGLKKADPKKGAKLLCLFQALSSAPAPQSSGKKQTAAACRNI